MTITWEVISAVIVVFGVLSSVWWRVEGMIRATTDALAAHKLEVAQHYVTKAGLTEQTMQIMKAIESVGSKVDHLNGRIDGLMKPAATRTRAG